VGQKGALYEQWIIIFSIEGNKNLPLGTGIFNTKQNSTNS